MNGKKADNSLQPIFHSDILKYPAKLMENKKCEHFCPHLSVFYGKSFSEFTGKLFSSCFELKAFLTLFQAGSLFDL